MSDEKRCTNCQKPTNTKNFRGEPYCETCFRAYQFGHAMGHTDTIERLAKSLDRTAAELEEIAK
jgi:hypothetical protein